MSRRHSQEKIVTIAESAEILECIREEQARSSSSVNINEEKQLQEDIADEEKKRVIICPCKAIKDAEAEQKHAEEINKLLKEKEEEMEEQFQERVEIEMDYLKNKFDFILHNEQVRASYMLREAHRERQEKISALQTQLECKNLAGLMYVMCSERRKSKLEIMRLCEEYNNYIESLQKILEESQALILHLSRGYKTAARVDYEWREKMKKVIKHYQQFVDHFTGSTHEANQYLFDLPTLLKVDADIQDNPLEDPCESEDFVPVKEEKQTEKHWWDDLEGDHPFVVFGDMADLKPPQRREVLKSVKAAKTAPKKWKEYAFNNTYLKSNCPHADVIKHEYLKIKPEPDKWECTMQMDRQTLYRGSETSRRVTTTSVDIRGTMGSILKMFSSNGVPVAPKSTLLGARDSMEIASTTKLREKHRHTMDHDSARGTVVLNIGNKIDSLFKEMRAEEEEIEEDEDTQIGPKETKSKVDDEEDSGGESMSALGSVVNDSLQVISSHVPDQDHKINYEKICPMEKCQKMQVDSFMRTLPPYMRASPFMHFEQSYDEYEPCTPEQLQELQRRIDEKKQKMRSYYELKEQQLLSWSPSIEEQLQELQRRIDEKKQKMRSYYELKEQQLLSWSPSIEGMAVQTSDMSASIPSCTCQVPSPTPASASSGQNVFTVSDFIPVKQKLDHINEKCFFNNNIEFNRFKVIGHDESVTNFLNAKENGNKRLQEIKKILELHPSLCDIFQGNVRC